MASLLSADELAERLGVSYQTILAWRRRGWIAGRRAIGPGGGRLVFDLCAVRQALAGQGERVLLARLPDESGDAATRAGIELIASDAGSRLKVGAS